VMQHLCSYVHSNGDCTSDVWEPVESASDMVSPCGAFHSAVTLNIQIIFNLRDIIYSLHLVTDTLTIVTALCYLYCVSYVNFHERCLFQMAAQKVKFNEPPPQKKA
jgi:hypothetical protein